MFEYNKLSITWSGHAGFKIIYGNMKVYIDPYKLSKSYEKISDADIVLITHNHFDHLSIEDLKISLMKEQLLFLLKSVYLN